YYLFNKDTIKAVHYASKAKDNSKLAIDNDGLLSSYLLLSKLETDKKGKEYLGEYIKLSDSLQQQEREIREKFTRIAYETNEIAEERDEVVSNMYKVILFSVIAAGVSILLFITMRQRSKNKELQSKQKQDEANVEIYNLMLSQQKMFNKGSIEEKNRISKELHDGVLGRLFGARMCLDALNEGVTEDEILGREKNIKDLQSIEVEIRKISHNLKSSLFDSDTSFNELVDQLVSKQSKIIKFEYKLSFSNELSWENISNTIKINCYRILQVALQNINLYSEAKTVKINFSKENDSLLFSIEDDGIGFDTKTKKEGIGLKNIKSRIMDLKGKVDMRSKQNIGTKINIKIPV
ncbi:MAG: two-component sensor histidine kinase, partial [Bacteroidetes bacterium]|nr:two-component sensor histidine kinase [Bacteroidota bacterium]